MNQNKNEFVTASTVFLADTTIDEQPMVENKGRYVLHPEMYYG
jgi:hypothetical protein